MLHYSEMSDHIILVNTLLEHRARNTLATRRKRERDLELDYEIQTMWKEAEVEKAKEESDLQDLQLRQVQKLTKRAEKKALKAALDYKDAKELPLEVPEHVLKKQRLKTAEELEASRAAGPAPPVGSWFEKLCSLSATVTLAGVTMSINTGGV
jgi:hypothetical protein